MMKKRVFKKPDGGVIIATPSHKYQGGYYRHKNEKIYERFGLINEETIQYLNSNIHSKNLLIMEDFIEMTFENVKFPEHTKGLEYIDLKASDVPVSNSRTGNYQEMIHFDGSCKKENLKQDKNWEAVLMPTFLIQQKHYARVNKKINSESVFSYQLEKEKCKNWSEYEWYEQALKNLDERVADGEPDKPQIREKLKAKIKKLKKN